jgi:hypothetical protein
MSTSLENYAEQLAVVLLKASAGLTAIIPSADIVRESEDTGADKDRIVCKCGPREIELYGSTPQSVKVWRLPLDVTLYYSTENAAAMDTAIAEIQAAMNTTPNSAGVTIYTAAKIRCINDTDEGDFATEEQTRKRNKRFIFLAEP